MSTRATAVARPPDTTRAPVPGGPTLLEVRDIHVGYGSRDVLRAVSLEIPAGDVVALIGTNGAGKSTLLKAIAGLLDLRGGELKLDGIRLDALSPSERVRHGLGYLIQGGRVFISLSVRENLEMGARLRPPAERQSALHSVIELFPELGRCLNKRAGLLSGGERQALALGMVLAQGPRLLLLDEPTSGLSPALAEDVLEKVRQLNRVQGTTVVLVEQRVRPALAIADQAIALRNGQVVRRTEQPVGWLEEGALDDIFLT